MTYIIAEPCVGTCDTICVEVCPVDCIHGPNDVEGSVFFPEVGLHPEAYRIKNYLFTEAR